jgi:hypothetical protein
MPAIDNILNTITSIPMTDQASTPATPASGKSRIFTKSDGLYVVDDAGGVTGPMGEAGLTNPMTTAGDVIFGGASGTPTRLAIGTAAQVLKVNAGATAPEWGAAPAGAGGYPYQVVIPYASPTASSGTLNINADTSVFGAYRIYTTAQNNYLEYPVLLAAGTWKLEFYTSTGEDRAIVTVTLDGASVGTVDTFGSSTTNVLKTLSGITVATSGVMLMRFTAATKNGSSSNYTQMFYVVTLTRTGA